MTFVLEIAKRVEARGVPLVLGPNINKGNGSAWANPNGVDGHVNHHTGGGNNIYLDGNLTSGVPGLSGPLCNYAILYDGDLAVVSLHPANHAGASGGWDTWPLPITRDFNRRTLGTEIQYRGVEPMSGPQYQTMCILNEEIRKWHRWPDFARCKTHNGTSVEGKWDPGYAPGKTYDIGSLRRDYAVRGGSGQAPAEVPAGWVLPLGLYYGPLEGDENSISGLWRTDRQEWRDALAAWQRATGIGADGLYGPATAARAREVQEWAGFKVDGLIGPGTYAAGFNWANRGDDFMAALTAEQQQEMYRALCEPRQSYVEGSTAKFAAPEFIRFTDASAFRTEAMVTELVEAKRAGDKGGQ
ncbi:peptidoglycan-binding domain-containing protein [Rhodococcoides fascians]|uniref:peptidoglycan-binding domain-containing protein n=1 Tax=Rhodococcoides fascians TaxID=1828 RepID=UPI00068E7795|nr:peptidoglycan-binding domain-containing protein [Rhodococcus fascians]